MITPPAVHKRGRRIAAARRVPFQCAASSSVEIRTRDIQHTPAMPAPTNAPAMVRALFLDFRLRSIIIFRSKAHNVRVIRAAKPICRRTTERGKILNPEYSICRDQPTSRASPLRINALLCAGLWRCASQSLCTTVYNSRKAAFLEVGECKKDRNGKGESQRQRQR